MDREPSYSAERAANVVLGMTIVAAIVCVIAGVLQLRNGSNLGWLLFGIGLLPLVAALLIRRSLKHAAEANSQPN